MLWKSWKPEFSLQVSWACGGSGFFLFLDLTVFCSMPYIQSLSWELLGSAGKGYTLKGMACSVKGVL